MNKKPYVVIGGGPVGLLIAFYLSIVKKQDVVLVDQQPQLGGMYSGVKTPWGVVDQGVHIPQESGNPIVDELFFEALPKEHWNLLCGVKRDVAGNFFAGRLNFDSLYPDLRLLPHKDYLRCLAGLMDCASTNHKGFGEVHNLKAFFEDRFGAFCTDRVFDPIARKIWRQPSDQLSAWAAKIIHLTRVVTHDHETSAALKASPALDAVIGFPEQLVVSEAQLQSRISFYPKNFGLDGFVNLLTTRLLAAGVRLLTSSTVTGFKGEKMDAIKIKNLKSGAVELVEAERVVWSSPLPALAKLLNVKCEQLHDAPLPHRVLHLFLDQAPETRLLYWLWSYDGEDDLIRISTPEAYSPDAANAGIHPICVEMHASSHDVSDECILRLAEIQLRARGLISPKTSVLGGKVHESNRFFFVPTIANCDAMIFERKAVEASMPDNMVLATQDLNAGIFYLPEILSAGIYKLKKQ